MAAKRRARGVLKGGKGGAGKNPMPKRKKPAAREFPDDIDDDDDDEDDEDLDDEVEESEEEEDDAGDEPDDSGAAGDKSKRERFKELAPKRLRTVLKAYKVLKNCAAKSNYEYTPNEAEQIIAHLRKGLDQVEAAFTQKAGDDDLDLEFDD